MFFLILSLIFLIPSFIFWWKHRTEEVRTYSGGKEWSGHRVTGFVLIWTSVLFLFLSVVIVNGVVYMDQVQDIEKIEQIQANKAIYEIRAIDLTDRFSILLETKYPEYEGEVFKNLTPQNAELVFVVYPQLRAIEGFTKLVDQIKELRDKIYAQDIEIEQKERKIRVRDRNIFYLTWLLPH